MLYVTTRNHLESYTVHHVLTESRGKDGGLYVPRSLPKFTPQEWRSFSEKSFGQCVAEILNVFFSAKLTGWDVDFAVGRYPVRMEFLAHRIVMAELWHNPDLSVHRLERNLRELLQADAQEPGNWISIAIRMAVLAGILSSRELNGIGLVDLSLISGDFTLPVSAWYLRKMGFPVGNIICCCNENKPFWELICNGQMHTDAVVLPSVIPEADVAMPVNLERFISDCAGIEETERYLECCNGGNPYAVSDIMLSRFRQGLYASVVSSVRVETTIPNAYNTHNYLMTPAEALAYSGLLDYRAKTGISRTSIVLCDQNPVLQREIIAKTMNLPVSELEKLF